MARHPDTGTKGLHMYLATIEQVSLFDVLVNQLSEDALLNLPRDIGQAGVY